MHPPILRQGSFLQKHYFSRYPAYTTQLRSGDRGRDHPQQLSGIQPSWCTHSSVTSRHIHSHIYTHTHMYTHTCNTTAYTITFAYTLCAQRHTKAELHTPTCPYNCIHTLRHTKKLCTTRHMFICTHIHMHLPMQTIKCIHSYTHTITHACTGPHIHLTITQPQPLTHVPRMETRCLRTCYFHVLQQPPTHSEEERILPPAQQQPVDGPGLGVYQVNSQVQHHLQTYGPQASLLLLSFIHITALSEKRKLLSGKETFDSPRINNSLKGLAPWWQKEIMY